MRQTLIGQTLLNQYRVEEFIARTPLGDLHRAVDARTERPYALTLLPKNVYEDSESFKEIESQAGKLRRLSHPHLIPYLGVYQTPAFAFLLEDWVDGPSLRDVMKQNAALTTGEALSYLQALSNGLGALHNEGFLHLNLAPEFIRVDKKGRIFLGGLGGAQKVGSVMRKTGRYPRWYAAPESFSTQPLSAAADTYALAALLYEAVASAWLNGADAPTAKDAIRKMHAHETPPAPITLNPALPDHFSRMILWGLRKKPEDRFQSGAELLSALSLAARVGEIAPAIPLESDWQTAKVLQAWKFLPAPKSVSVAQDHAPLEDRLAALDSARPKKTPRASFIPLVILILLGGFASLFWLVRPAPPQKIQAAATLTFTPFAADYTPPPSVTPSPRPTDAHGGRIAFTCTRGDYNQICMVNRDGSGLAQLSDMNASSYYPVFTHDGEGLLFASNRNGTFDFYLLNFGKKELHQITRNLGNVISPSYAPDGRQIVFANRAGDTPTAIWIVNADGLNPRLAYQGAGDIVGVAWSPNGKKIAYAMSVGAPLEYEIFLMDSSGKNHTRLSQNLQGIGGSLSWSPDGSHLLIYAGTYEDKNIFKLDARTGASVQLTFGGNNAGAAYSPDGKYIVFNSLRNNGQADLYIMRADGSNETQLTNHPEPDWGANWIQ